MLTVMPHESLYGFIYRTYFVNGIIEYESVLSKTGSWYPFPIIHNKFRHLFEPIDDALFLSLLKELGHESKNRSSFVDTFYYQMLLDNLFAIRRHNIKMFPRPFPIMYCVKCIKEDIVKYGFGYIKSFWTFSTKCYLHNTPLNILKASTRSSTIIELQRVLAAKPPKKYKLPNLNYLWVSSDIRSKEDIYPVDYYLPCIQRSLDKYVNSRFLKLNIKQRKVKLGRAYNSHARINSSDVQLEIFTFIKSNRSLIFERYKNKYFEEIEIYTGIINKKSLKEIAYKLSNSKCSDCEFEDCAANINFDNRWNGARYRALR